ncbi:cytochrome b-c1 complex subunit 9-like [Papaver somniferum]|uniref:cytochrome b-c1 complex subunit 9-like n=1 Tax=Papaver somniferum TaxID=3469 RepID=UPI000E70007F|nr:cytochrome b-c1 complex subunit 9-like [Papaver somniferum]
MPLEGYTSHRSNLTTKAVTEVFYKLFMQRNSVYIPVVLAGAFAGEKAVDYGVKKLWDMNNAGKRFEDISVFQKPILRS